jgi:broad specificity phosphatase PhoE
MKTIYILRHGETDWNKEGRHQTYTDIPVNENGAKQDKEVALLLKNKKIDIIYHSTKVRTKQRSDEIAKYHPNTPILEKSRLVDISLGVLEGLTKQEDIEKFPEVYEQRKKDKFNYKPPKGESYKNGIERTKPFIEEILSSDKDIAIVGHQGINRCILGQLLNIKQEEIPHIRIPHNCIYEIKIYKTKVKVFYHYKNQKLEGLLK